MKLETYNPNYDMCCLNLHIFVDIVILCSTFTFSTLAKLNLNFTHERWRNSLLCYKKLVIFRELCHHYNIFEKMKTKWIRFDVLFKYGPLETMRNPNH